MAVVDELKILVTAEVAQAVANLNKVQGSTQKAGGGFKDFAKQVAGYTTAAGLAVSATKAIISGTINLAKESISLAMGFEKARISWGVMLGDMGEGEKMFSRIQDFAAKTPLSFEAVESAARTLKGFGIEAEDIIPTLGKLGDVSQGNSESLSHLALVFGQVKAQGKAMAQDLYQFVNAGIPIFDMLAKSMGVSAGEVKALGAEGKLTFEEIEKAITKATSSGGMFEGMMDKTAQTASGQLSNAVDNAKRLMAGFGDNLLKIVTPALKAFNDAMADRDKDRDLMDVISKKEAAGLEKIKAVLDDKMEAVRQYARDYEIPFAVALESEQGLGYRTVLDIYNKAKALEEEQAAAAAAAAKIAADAAAKEAQHKEWVLKKAQEALDTDNAILANYLTKNEYELKYFKGADDILKKLKEIANVPAISPFDAEVGTGGLKDMETFLKEDFPKIVADLPEIRLIPDMAENDPEKLEAYIQPWEDFLKEFSERRESEEWLEGLAPDDEDINSWDRYVEEIKKAEEALSNFKTGYDAITDVFQAYIDLQGNMGDVELARMKKSGATDEEIAKRKAELQKKEFDNQKALSIANALVSGAEASVKALTAGPIAGPILAGIIAATTGAQVAMISSQQYVPALADGGIVRARPGGTIARLGEAGSDEAVIPLNKAGGRFGTTIIVQGSLIHERQLEQLLAGVA